MIKFISKFAVALILVFGVVACESEETQESDSDGSAVSAGEEEPSSEGEEQQAELEEPDSELVVTARELGGRVDTFRENPEELDAWLEEQDMTEEEFEELLFEISEDEAASRAYSERQ